MGEGLRVAVVGAGPAGYTIILPLILAIVTATGVSRLLSTDTIYTLKLTRRGVKATHTTRAPRSAYCCTVAAPLPLPAPVTTSAPFGSIPPLTPAPGPRCRRRGRARPRSW